VNMIQVYLPSLVGGILDPLTGRSVGGSYRMVVGLRCWPSPCCGTATPAGARVARTFWRARHVDGLASDARAALRDSDSARNPRLHK